MAETSNYGQRAQHRLAERRSVGQRLRDATKEAGRALSISMPLSVASTSLALVADVSPDLAAAGTGGAFTLALAGARATTVLTGNYQLRAQDGQAERRSLGRRLWDATREAGGRVLAGGAVTAGAVSVADMAGASPPQAAALTGAAFTAGLVTWATSAGYRGEGGQDGQRVAPRVDSPAKMAPAGTRSTPGAGSAGRLAGRDNDQARPQDRQRGER
ncbi:MAG: hypothetical protein GEV07_15260 [Streptosporangiales bacterium]|nr:hypothetical protein [Streptosporangiales bacterium]